MIEFSVTRQTAAASLLIILLVWSSSVCSLQLKPNSTRLNSTRLNSTRPNICFRCDFNGGKKVKPCPTEGFDTSKIEVIECGYQKPVCGITVNVTTDKPKIIYAGCYSRRFNRHCFKDLVRQYQSINGSFCYHTCSDGLLCNPYESWSKGENSGFNLFKLSIFG